MASESKGKKIWWRYKNDIPSESKFSRVFKELSEMQIAQKAHEQFVKEYLSDKTFFYNAIDSTKIPLRQKPVKINIKKTVKTYDQLFVM